MKNCAEYEKEIASLERQVDYLAKGWAEAKCRLGETSGVRSEWVANGLKGQAEIEVG